MKKSLILILVLIFTFSAKAQESDSLKNAEPGGIGFSLAFTPTSLFVHGFRFDAEIPLSRRRDIRLFAAPVIFEGISTAYAHTRNRQVINTLNLNNENGFLEDRISGLGLELGLKKRFLKEPFLHKDGSYNSFYAFSVGLNRIFRDFDDAGWLEVKEDGLTTYTLGTQSYRDRIWQGNLSAFVGQKVFFESFFTEFFMGMSYRHSFLDTDNKERQHQDWLWLDEAYSGFIIRAGMSFGFAARKDK